MRFLILLALFVAGCSAPSNAGAIKSGDSVQVDYVGSADGKVFDTSIKEEAEKAGLPLRPSYLPLVFQVGSQQVIPGFEKTVLGMRVGEEKTVVLAPDEAYGPVQKELIQKIPLTRLRSLSPLRVGSTVVSPEGVNGVVKEFDNESMTVDFNHPLAGKTLTFKIILRSVNSSVT